MPHVKARRVNDYGPFIWQCPSCGEQDDDYAVPGADDNLAKCQHCGCDVILDAVEYNSEAGADHAHIAV